MSRFANLEQIEMTFTIEDADLDKLNNVLKDINVRECPWFEVHDKHGNKAKYYREPHWIPCSEMLPKVSEHTEEMVLVCYENGTVRFGSCLTGEWTSAINPVAWMPIPEPYKGGQDD